MFKSLLKMLQSEMQWFQEGPNGWWLLWASDRKAHTTSKRNVNVSNPHSQTWWTLSWYAARSNTSHSPPWVSPPYIHGRKSFARRHCLFHTSPFDLCLFSPDLPNSSHAHCVEKTQDSGNLAKKHLAVPVSYPASTCALVCGSSLIAYRDSTIKAPLTQCCLDTD